MQDRIEDIVQRNNKRIEYISAKLEQMGIYNAAVDKKVFASALASESKNVSEKTKKKNKRIRKKTNYYKETDVFEEMERGF